MRYIAGVPKPQAASARVFKRYSNRKLYDPAGKRYVTLEDLAAHVGTGEEILVQDQPTGEDITNLVLAQVVLEGVKERTASIPRQVLARLVRLTAAPKPGKGTAPPPPSIPARARAEAERIVAGLLSRQLLSLEEALRLRQEIAHSVQSVVADAQRGLEQALHGLLERTEREGGVTLSLQSLKERLMTLETYLATPGATPRTTRQQPIRQKVKRKRSK